MKTKVRIALVALLGITLFAVGLPISSAAPYHQDKERFHSKNGPEVGKRVRDLQKYNSKVRAALNIFEANAKRNGHAPRLDESVSITRDPAGGSAKLDDALAPASAFRKVGFKPQDADYSGYGFEIIFIPAYTTATEWQGTAVINKYDPSGAYLGDYVADVAISGLLNDVIEEVSYEDGQAYLQYGSYDFQFGAPIDTQDPGAIQPLITSTVRPRFTNASYAPQGIGWEAGSRPHPPTGPPSPKIRYVIKCTVANSVGWGGVGCGVLALASAGGLFGPCAGAAVSASFTACTLTAIFG